MGGGTNPFAKIPCIGKGDGANDDTGVVIRLLRDVTSTGDDNLVGWPNLCTNELSLVTDKEAKVLHVPPLLPPS